MTSLNPTMTVGRQISETLRYHQGLEGEAARRAAIELLEQVQIPEAKSRVDNYPFLFSGGMRQRVMIAMAIACRPALLIADEPTTALDVTVQAQILDLMQELQRANQMSVIHITHDLGVVARMADEVAVMYAGQIVETGDVHDIFARPSHPYTLGLQAARPPPDERRREKLEPIEGAPPDLFKPPVGCAYFERCPWAMRVCEGSDPPLCCELTLSAYVPPNGCGAWRSSRCAGGGGSSVAITPPAQARSASAPSVLSARIPSPSTSRPCRRLPDVTRSMRPVGGRPSIPT